MPGCWKASCGFSTIMPTPDPDPFRALGLLLQVLAFFGLEKGLGVT